MGFRGLECCSDGRPVRNAPNLSIQFHFAVNLLFPIKPASMLSFFASWLIARASGCQRLRHRVAGEGCARDDLS